MARHKEGPGAGSATGLGKLSRSEHSTSSQRKSTKTAAQANALSFAKRGYAILPLHGIANGKCTCGRDCHSPGKHPHAHFVPQGKNDATTNAKMIKHWFERCPAINYGICTDKLPTVDIDPRNGGEKSWRKLLGTTRALPHTWTVATGGGGLHLLFAAPTELVPSGKLATGVDFKAASGYIVGVGSLHISGKRYRWAPDCGQDEVELCELPPWISDTIGEVKGPTSTASFPIRDAGFYNKLIAPALPGERHDRVAALLGHLFGSMYPNKGVLVQMVISHVHTWADLTDFDDEEIIRMAECFARNDERRRGGR